MGELISLNQFQFLRLKRAVFFLHGMLLQFHYICWGALTCRKPCSGDLQLPKPLLLTQIL